jgi:predicted nucleic acid-binding protein
MNSIYLNANIIYGECLKLIFKKSWNRNIKTGILEHLRKRNYRFSTSILTRTEIMQRLVREEQLRANKAREIYKQITEKYEIYQIESLNKKNLLTNYFMDVVAKSNLDFKDALHLDIASKNELIVVTHDKKFHKNYSMHKDKLKFYSKVIKPEELLNN